MTRFSSKTRHQLTFSYTQHNYARCYLEKVNKKNERKRLNINRHMFTTNVQQRKKFILRYSLILNKSMPWFALSLHAYLHDHRKTIRLSRLKSPILFDKNCIAIFDKNLLHLSIDSTGSGDNIKWHSFALDHPMKLFFHIDLHTWS